MALIECPECGQRVSSRAAGCPSCGCPPSRHNGTAGFLILFLSMAFAFAIGSLWGKPEPVKAETRLPERTEYRQPRPVQQPQSLAIVERPAMRFFNDQTGAQHLLVSVSGDEIKLTQVADN